MANRVFTDEELKERGALTLDVLNQAIESDASAKTVTYDVTLSGERLRDQIRKAKKLTDKPFAVHRERRSVLRAIPSITM